MKKILSGFEYECTSARPTTPEWDLIANNYVRKHDGSVHGDSIEFVSARASSPADTIRHFRALLANCQTSVDSSCGTHFHFSVNRADSDERLCQRVYRKFTNNLYFIGSQFEEALFDLMPESRRNNEFCKKLSLEFSAFTRGKTLRAKMGTIHGNKYDNRKRYCWINFVELWRRDGIGTVEFRLLGETKRIEYIAAVYYTFLLMVRHALTFDLYNDVDCFARLKRDMQNALEDIARVRNPRSGVEGQAFVDQFIENKIAQIVDLQDYISGL